MISDELSNTLFRFSLRCLGAELAGGVFKHPPPPSMSWKIQTASRARVKASLGTITIITGSSGSSSVRRSEPVGRCLECWQSDNSLPESPCQHTGHRLSGCRVRAIDRAALPELLVKMAMLLVGASSGTWTIYSTLKSIVQELLTCKAVWLQRGTDFYTFLKNHN